MNGKVALVTGAGSGMGEAAAIMFAQAGASVVVADVNEEAAKAVAQKINAKGQAAIAVRCDVTDAEQVRSMVDKAVEIYGRIDAAFNNAGIQSPATDIADLEEDEYDRIMDINLKGVWLCMKYELQQMKKQGSGAIVNNSSIGGLIGLPGRAAYHAAKHGVLGMTKSAAAEYAAKGILINAVCPGTIETPMVQKMIDSGDLPLDEAIKLMPIGRLGHAEEVAAAVLWLCSPAASFIVGQSIAVDGGFTIV
ncbi:glucose 1-dehydrogenase [Mucilaginibacter sp. KACC 22773]|uniref:SDR family NAD(P)-dependent oxidoreductase n=1 Tax=Mucilaginibacter sp. KACC 22773 TaxID=3025671 RepID=UPI0023661D19|nr:glucose 1-dehydrogenase [Mucilaginibacter sp. KACC 22773]WDF77209.1 glucose 1-dehydrogenase [Mucilaginibacter sp. KACC 22773]